MSKDVNEFKDKSKKIFRYLINTGKNVVNSRLSQGDFKWSMNTPYEFQKLNNADFEVANPELLSEDSGFREFAKDIFKHYEVNPSDKYYRDRIVNTYVPDVTPIPELRDLTIANKGKINDLFYNKIINTMNKIKNSDSSLLQEDRTAYVTGGKGSGKTAFFNYLISKCEEELNRSNIITARINVMRILDDTTLEQAIYFKLCRILFTYYSKKVKPVCPRLDGRNFKDTIDPILDKMSRLDFTPKDIDDCHKYFCSINPSDLSSIPSKYENIFNVLLKYMFSTYKFLIMLDNFDQLSPNDTNKNNWEKRNHELCQLQFSDIFLHSMFLIAVRYNTYTNLSFNGKGKPIPFSIGSPTTYDMINYRMDYTINKCNFSSKDSEKYKNDIVDCINLMGTSFISGNTTPSNYKDTCSSIDLLFSGNKRIILNMIVRLFGSINRHPSSMRTDSYLTRHQYKFFESLLINPQTGYCDLFYEYDSKGDNNIINFGNLSISPHYDNNYIPNIYRFPSIVADDDMMFIPFLKIRILQLLKNWQNKGRSITINRIVKVLNNIFRYNKGQILASCIELREDQCIIAKNYKFEATPTNTESQYNLAMDITDRGIILLDILPVNVNLLAVALEHIFFPENCLENIPIGNYYNDNDFIVKNICYSLPYVIGMLEEIEEIEKIMCSKIKNRIKSFNDPSFIRDDYEMCYKIDTDFSFTNNLEKSAIITIDNILNTHFDCSREDTQISVTHRTRRQKLIDQYSTLWSTIIR